MAELTLDDLVFSEELKGLQEIKKNIFDFATMPANREQAQMQVRARQIMDNLDIAGLLLQDLSMFIRFVNDKVEAAVSQGKLEVLDGGQKS
jgi:hypothetical protein